MQTERLLLQPLSINDAAFILELVNTAGWLQFIGNRNVNNEKDAKSYIQNVLNNSNVTYWVVSTLNSKNPIGIITFIKRNYLPHHDIGFAFLPQYANNGYAFEAANTVLQSIVANKYYSTVLATTIPSNTSSIKLLHKLGFEFDKEIIMQGETLSIYSMRLFA